MNCYKLDHIHPLGSSEYKIAQWAVNRIFNQLVNPYIGISFPYSFFFFCLFYLACKYIISPFSNSTNISVFVELSKHSNHITKIYLFLYHSSCEESILCTILFPYSFFIISKNNIVRKYMLFYYKYFSWKLLLLPLLLLPLYPLFLVPPSPFLPFPTTSVK